MIATFIVRFVVLGFTLGGFAFFVFIARGDVRASPIPTLFSLALIWLFEGLGLRILLQLMIPMLQSSGVLGFALECALWPWTVWECLGLS